MTIDLLGFFNDAGTVVVAAPAMFIIWELWTIADRTDSAAVETAGALEVGMCYKTRGEAQAIGIIRHEKALGRPIVALLSYSYLQMVHLYFIIVIFCD